jgi:hypothetical protein
MERTRRDPNQSQPKDEPEKGTRGYPLVAFRIFFIRVYLCSSVV